MDSFIKLYLFFWILAILGWILEIIVCFLYDKKLVNRGFLLGPYCPIYGFGGLAMMIFLPFKDYPLVVFPLSFVVCSVLEYFTSYIMEKIFHVRWWDYSHDAFNINGRVCLRNALAFGALGVLFTKYLHPFIYSLLNSLSYEKLFYIYLVVLVITLIDFFVSFNAMNKIKKTIKKNVKNYQNIDATQDIKELINNTITESYFVKRLIKTYHLFEKESDDFFKKLSKRDSYAFLLIFAIIGLIIGIIISLMMKKDNISIIISLTLLIAILIAKVGKK